LKNATNFFNSFNTKKTHKNLQFFLSFSFTLTHCFKNLILSKKFFKKISIFGPKLQDMILHAKKSDFCKIEFFAQKIKFETVCFLFKKLYVKKKL